MIGHTPQGSSASSRPAPRRRPVWRAGLLAAGCWLLAASAQAEADGPDYFRVRGVAAGQMLAVHTEPDASAPVSAQLAATADGLRNLGCSGGPAFADAEQRAVQAQRWCRVETPDASGWVLAQFLAEGSAPAAPPAPKASVESGNALFGSWRLVAFDDHVATAESTLTLSADGNASGLAGCNRFHGSAQLNDNGTLTLSPLAVTRMACADDELGKQEAAFLDSMQRVTSYAASTYGLILFDGEHHAALVFAPAR